MTAPKWSYRTRLSALIAGVFIVGGAAVVAVQYLVVRQLFDSELDANCVSTGAQGGCNGDVPGSPVEMPGTPIDVEVLPGGGQTTEVTASASSLAEAVLSGLLGWSIVVLAVFAVIAIVAARWLSGRSLGRIARITSTVREITRLDLDRRLDLTGPDDEVKELGETLDGMLDRLRDAFERQERFIAGASHELRTPLTTTRAALEIPLAQGRVPVALVPDVERALAATARSEEIIAALLVLARSRYPGDLPLGSIDLTAITDGCLREGADRAAQRGLHVRSSIDEPLHARGDPALVRVAIGNLVENAIGHNVDGGSIDVRGGRDDQGSWIEIENDGLPLDDTDVSRLGEPFNRGSASRLAGGGLGLGLSLAFAVADSMHGSLVLSARPGGGLVAKLTFSARAQPPGP